jgi:chitin synthase
MYRLRTADKGRPLIISDKVINDYSDGDVDTLHKKNLLSLGEDRYLTTLMMKHFPGMSYKFVPTALAYTAAPDTWSVLLSQRRRWINSTIHNLAELVFLKDMCGFCCFSMRFVVFIDLFGTIILPATCAYLAYLLYMVGTKQGQFPLISIVMLSAVYGLQAVIFIIKRQWQHIGWMIIYMIAFPIYSFVLPIYSFWKQDDFSWGSTRMVLEEKGKSKVVQFDKDDGFNPRDIPLMRWDDYAHANGLPGGRGEPLSEKFPGGDGMGYEGAYEMDSRSVVSSVKPASAFNGGMGGGLSMPNPIVGARSSMYTLGGQHHAPPRASYVELPGGPRASYVELPGGPHRRSGSMGSDAPLAPRPVSTAYPVVSGSAEHLPSPTGSAAALRSRSALGLTPPGGGSPRPVSMAAGGHLGVDARAEARMSAVSLGPVNFMDGPRTGPSDAEIAAAVRDCLAEVDIERFTKKQLVALVELKLQCQVTGDRKKALERWIDVELERLPV